MNINTFWNNLLAAFGDATGASEVNEFRTKLVTAVTDNVVSPTTITPLGGTITGATANDTMTAVADIALSTSNTYTDAAVNAAVNTAIAEIENNLADLQAKVNALITAVG